MMTAIRRYTNRFKVLATNDERGLTTVEYIVVLLLVAVFGIGAWTSFGGALQSRIGESTDDINAISNPGPGNATQTGQTGR